MFKKKNRIPKDSIVDLLKSHKLINNGFFSLKFRENNLSLKRFAVIVPKKAEKSSVKRHLIKRRYLNAIKEEFNLEIRDLDFLVFVSKNGANLSFLEIKKEIKEIFNKNKVLFYR